MLFSAKSSVIASFLTDIVLKMCPECRLELFKLGGGGRVCSDSDIVPITVNDASVTLFCAV